MSTTITVRDIDPSDKSWLQSEARRRGLSMEEFLRRIIHEQRKQALVGERPSAVFRRYFGPDHGIELPLPRQYGYVPRHLDQESED